MPTSPFKRFARKLARPLTSPVDGRVADVNRRIGSIGDRLSELGEQVERLQRGNAANATTIVESNTYTGVELRRFDEALNALQATVEAHQARIGRQIDAITERAYAERLTDATRAPLRSALDGRLQLDRPLVLADIGCRWGIPVAWRGREADLRVYAFDADEQECERLQAEAPAGLTYVPLALGANEEEAVLHIASDPGCSSLFRPDSAAIETFPEMAAIAEVDERQVSLRTLDGWATELGVSAIDAMKLDVQGAELQVLRGAEGLLPNVRLIELEVTFNQMYEGQPLFSEVDVYMREHGFLLWRLAHLVHYASSPQQALDVKRLDRQFFDSVPVDFPAGAGQLTWAHAYYCAPELVRGGWSSSSAALRDACVAELFGFQELVQPALQTAASLDAAGR